MVSIRRTALSLAATVRIHLGASRQLHLFAGAPFDRPHESSGRVDDIAAVVVAVP
jgi:hypothetical protein